MKKNVLTILGVVGVIAILGLIFMPREKLKEMNIPFVGNEKNKENEENKGTMKFISDILPTDYKNGYFYIKHNGEEENIMYFDYDAKKEVYVCNKPNCKHDSDSCSSYFDFAESNELFYYNDALYTLNSSAGGVSMSITADGIVSDTTGSPSTIYKMKLDGTDKEKLFTAPSGTKISMPFVMKGNMLYGFLEKSKVEEGSGHTFTTSVTERKLVAINLSTGKYEELTNGLHASLIGTYNDKLVIQEIDYIKDPDSFGDNTNAFRDNLYNSKTKIKLFDVETKKEEVIFEEVFKNIESMQFYKNGIYFIGEKSKNLEYFDFATKKEETIKELPQSNMELGTIIDDKILVYAYKNKDAKVGASYYIDLKNKEMKGFSLKDKNEYLVEILASNDDYYFVETETILGDVYTTWAGTKQQDIIGTNYALIKKADYWASKANYIKMTNAK